MARSWRAKRVQCPGSYAQTGANPNEWLNQPLLVICTECGVSRPVNLDGRLSKHTRDASAEQELKKAAPKTLQPTMNEQESREWATLLGDEPLLQLAIIYDLLHWATEDQMSGPDRVVCVREFQRLERELGVNMEFSWACDLLVADRARKLRVPANVEDFSL